MKLRILALVPARGGSKGVPGKNTKPLAGMPLIAWTLRAARDSEAADRILVSTDSPEIAAAAADCGFRPPWLRPAALASDESPSIDAVIHALDRLAEEGYAPDAVLLLQPTSPFRSAESIRAAVELYERDSTESLISVSPVDEHPWGCSFLRDGRLVPVIPDAPKISRRQDLPPAYAPDGCLYITATARLRKSRAFSFPDTIPFLTPEGESLDIDTPLDWAVAEALAKR